jgi:flagellar motor protein MotB
MQLFGSSKLTAQTAVIALIAGLLGAGVVMGVASPAEANGAPQCSTSASTNPLYSGTAGQDGSDFTAAYRISTAADLIRISQTTSDWTNRFFLQTADIDLGGCYWDPIGEDTGIGNIFSGGFYDGGYFKITGLNINDTSGSSGLQGVGLFGYSTWSVIRNLTVSGAINSNSPSVGGILGRGTASLTAVRSEVNIDYNGSLYVGGVVGQLNGGVVSYSSYKGTIKGLPADKVGGLVGSQEGTTFASYVVSVPDPQDVSNTAFRGGGLFSNLASSNTSQSYAVVPQSSHGIAYGAAPFTSSGLFWSTSGGPAFAVTGSGSLAGATGKTTAEMQSIDTYTAASWEIVSGWEPEDTNNGKVWGICSLVNNGYPFLLWEFSSNPCVVPSSGSSGSSGFSIAPPSSAVAEISLSGSGLKKSSMLRVRLTKLPAVFEQLVLVVRLNDFQNALLQELRVPIAATATFVDVPIDRPVGQFNVFAQTSNAGSASAGVFLKPHTVKQSALRKAVQGKPARLLGSQLGKDILFGSGSASLTPEAKMNLRQAAKLAKASDSRVSVTGIAGAASNSSKAEKRLAEKRALRVANYLSRQSLTNWIYYFGLSSGKSAEIKGQPQRVEIRILR